MKPYLLIVFGFLFFAVSSLASWREVEGGHGRRVFINDAPGALMAEFHIQVSRNTNSSNSFIV